MSDLAEVMIISALDRCESRGACPIIELHKEYVGLAALATAWRFYDDHRTENRERHLRVVQTPNGLQMCGSTMNCVKACPRGVASAGAIRRQRAAIESSSISP